jgi:hypothetical protein
MLRLIRSNERRISAITLLAFLIQVFYPVQGFSLTGGPSQPEFESFEPAGATEMVNLATGDFVYNIPLLDVDGYPINISYHGGVGMEQEASWVGLGWSLHPGAINRGMRGLPDDFNGGSDAISEEIHIEPNKTYGVNIGGGFEVVGFDILSLGLSAGLGILYNNYKGLGLELEVGVSGGVQASYMGQSAGLSGGLGLKVSSQDGADFSMSGGLGVQVSAGVANGSLGVNRTKVTNSRRGVTDDIISGSASMGVSVAGASFGKTTGSAINLIPNTAYVPNMQYPTTFSGITGEIHGGGEFFWCNAHAYLRAYKFEQGIAGSGGSMSISRPGFGYLNLEKANLGSLLDFNRDNDGVYYLECPKLPFSNLTYDLFSINAQGLNELFRPYRNDLGYVFDPIVTGGGTAHDIGIEGNYGSYFEIGFNDYGVTTNSTSGPWLSTNQAYSNGVRFSGDNQLTNNGTNTYEHAYFKALDEMPIEDQGFYNSILGKDLSSFKLIPISGSVNSILGNTIQNTSSGTSAYTGQKKNSREARNTNFSYLDIANASKFALDKTITNHAANVFNYNTNGDIDKSLYPSLNRDFGISGINHHISEVTVLKEDGSRYVYGVPIYNRKQKEVIFNCKGNPLSGSDNTIVGYTPGSDNSTGNNKGKDKFFLGRNLPSYAHSYLLTGLVSKDYVDITGDGLTNDDYGDYTKFNYSRTSSNYSWRNPCTVASEAIFDDGWRADDNDDKGVYIYGEKDVWYPHSIETKNFVAEFHVSPREDAHGVNGENGGISSASNNNSYKLDKIILYSKKDKTLPIKTVNFQYSYKLCPGTPNSIASSSNPTKGKLTLEKVFFTYGKSDKGVFSPYDFEYCDFNHDGNDDAGLNPSYARKNMDRWGSYQLPVGVLDNKDFPYTHQNQSSADNNAAVWCLSRATTPAKSNIDVYYEADDYAYIQDKVPAQMLTMVGFSQSKPSSTFNPSSALSSLFQSSSPYTPNNYMVVDLSRMYNGGLLANSISDAENILRNNMLPSFNKIYFKGLVQLGTSASTKEYVPGYAEFDRVNSGIIPFGSTVVGSKTLYKYAFIKLKDVDIEDPKNYAGDNCNPISKAAWQITRLYHPQIAYPGSEPGGSGLSALAGLFGAIAEVFTFKQKNNRLRKKGYGLSIDAAKSLVRLSIPTKTKLAGGHRVKRIEILDNWNNMVSNEASTTYGQTYNYTKLESGETISSGVTTYEPLAGGDEISLRKPIEYSVERIAAPNDAHFFEEPIGEAFYPAPTIIYSKIAVRNLDRTSGSSLIASNIGRTEYEFYTAKDFPVYAAYDGLQSYVHTPDPSGDLFNNYLESSVHLSQGFIIKLNNMHGKMKSLLSYQEGNNNPISGMKYYYKTTSNIHELDNNIAVIDETGNISAKIIGQHVEANADFRMQNTQTFATTVSGNLNVSPIPIPIAIPIPIPSVFWGTSTETRDFYSATLNKVVTQQGVLERVETISDFSSSTTENLVYDAKTNEVVLSRVTTNYKDHDYAYNTPAHWVYKGMGGAFKNIGYGFKNVITTSTGNITLTNGLLAPGDEIALQFTGSSDNLLGSYIDRLWVNQTSSGTLQLISRDGRICNTSGSLGTINVFATAPSGTANYVVQVLRSGYRNILEEQAENISFSSDPRSGAVIALNSNILDAEAREFSENWQKFCSNYDDACLPEGGEFCQRPHLADNTNPYIRNTKGNWNEVRTYSYLGKRLAKNTSGIYDIRKDGTFESYKPFYLFNTGAWKEVYNVSRSDYNSLKPFDNWIMNNEVTIISPYGNVLETKDAINRFSSELYGYHHTLKTSAAVNAKQREIGNDNFEDYFYGNNCTDNHFNFKKYKTNLAYGIAHTGRYSLKVSPHECVQIVKSITYRDCETAYGSNNVFVSGGTATVVPPSTLISTPRSVTTITSTPPSTLTPPPATLTSPSSATIIPPSATLTPPPATIIPGGSRDQTIPCDCISDFSPITNSPLPQKYVLSVWVKEAQLNKNADYTAPGVDVLLSPSTSPIQTLVKKSGVINGWQKLDYEFVIPANTAPTTVTFKLTNSGPLTAYFDDIRVHPFNASMAAYVYDPLSLRIWAELDERNFATIYEYDNEGILVRVKKETEKGIQTIKETRNSFKKQ